MTVIVATDTGGTFTDLVAYDLDRGEVRYAKSLTTYHDLVEGVMDCIARSETELEHVSMVKHGTTLVINTLVQRDGARAALVTTKGFRDSLEIGRGNRPTPFRIDYRRAPALVPRQLRFEVTERIHGQGEIFVPLDTAEVEALADTLAALDVDSVAVSFLNSYVDPRHEAAAAQILRDRLPGVYVTAGTELTREWYEYERTATAVANAYVGPRMEEYIGRLKQQLEAKGFSRTLYMMGSNGGVLSVERTLREPIMLVESGPIGGCIGAGVYADAFGLPNVIAFDMGGTTAKCALLENGQFDIRSPYYVGGYERGFPIRGSVIDIVEVGAGGGSIAWIDDQGRLHVGPRSAGSDPGPVAFGRGGVEPTVTDANLVLGRIGSDVFLDGDLRLDTDAARTAIAERVARPLGMGDATLEDVAEGILSLATVTMTGAIHQITVERGLDPRDFALFAYGGSGPIYGSALARDLHIPLVIVPPEPGNFSAIGMLLADARIDDARTFVHDLTDDAIPDMARAFDEIEQASRTTLEAEVGTQDITFSRTIEMRFRGQKHTFKTPVGEISTAAELRARFETGYRRRFGHADAENPVEIIALQVSAYARTQRPDIARLFRVAPEAATEPRRRKVHFARAGGYIDVPVHDRAALAPGFAAPGPLIIEEYGATTVIGPDDRCEIGSLGEIRIYCE